MEIEFEGEAHTVHAYVADLCVGQSIKVYLNEVGFNVLRTTDALVTMRQIDIPIAELVALIQDVATEYGELVQVVLLKDMLYLSTVNHTLDMEILYRTIVRYGGSR